MALNKRFGFVLSAFLFLLGVYALVSSFAGTPTTLIVSSQSAPSAKFTSSNGCFTPIATPGVGSCTGNQGSGAIWSVTKSDGGELVTLLTPVQPFFPDPLDAQYQYRIKDWTGCYDIDKLADGNLANDPYADIPICYVKVLSGSTARVSPTYQREPRGAEIRVWTSPYTKGVKVTSTTGCHHVNYGTCALVNNKPYLGEGKTDWWMKRPVPLFETFLGFPPTVTDADQQNYPNPLPLAKLVGCGSDYLSNGVHYCSMSVDQDTSRAARAYYARGRFNGRCYSATDEAGRFVDISFSYDYVQDLSLFRGSTLLINLGSPSLGGHSYHDTGMNAGSYKYYLRNGASPTSPLLATSELCTVL